ncbi:S-adenosylmethionine:tRNA ribosyltransferase-isomerase [Flammeovirgaceae bacterium SG7u.111]|nr:S-adenosylmethionine:tRNA ribosyltransferase-isomerase [Flammeovirgaceae bacterium SG7u.132]WPO37327.1 S-adenosylmethionine:tRNA ribosyltransferase-isomerase [Flammeovirgaceae bacterium SG7u.111]
MISISELEKIKISDFNYQLPEKHIAKFPLKERDKAKMLVYKDGNISHELFHDIRNHLGKNDTLCFNNTKVLPARLYFQKPTGATIEVFLLHPVAPTPVIQEAMLVKNEAIWACKIGNLKRWKEGSLQRKLVIEGKEITLSATVEDRDNLLVKLQWNDAQLNFVDVVQEAGNIPLPPYLKRASELSDTDDYQTVYSEREGAVAAPTAGLHFTTELLDELKVNGVLEEALTLHVSAGTFQPVSDEQVSKHKMHKEQVLVSKKNLETILEKRQVTAVGTTSLRTLESIYWYGEKLLREGMDSEFFIEKLAPYQEKQLPSLEEAVQAILNKMKKEGVEEIYGETEIFIFPGYDFKVCDKLITNYHLPKSTLILLIAAFVGEDWRKIYSEALNHNYRFLSYGDASLLYRKA